MICTTLNMYYVEWFVLRWVICTTLNDLNYVVWFVQHWIICTALNDLYYVEWFVLRWICTTLNDLQSVERFALSWMIWSAMDDFYNAESLDYNELLSIGFLMSPRCAYLRKYDKIFYTNLWFDFFLSWKCQEEIYLVLPQKLVIKS